MNTLSSAAAVGVKEFKWKNSKNDKKKSACSVVVVAFFSIDVVILYKPRSGTWLLLWKSLSQPTSSPHFHPFNLLIWKTRGRICENPSSLVVSSRVFPNRCALSFGPVQESCTTFRFQFFHQNEKWKSGVLHFTSPAAVRAQRAAETLTERGEAAAQQCLLS